MRDSTTAGTDCALEPLLFQELGARKVVADFGGGQLSSDGGALLLRQVDQALGVSRRLAGIVKKHGSEKHAREFSHWSHVVCLLFSKMVHCFGLTTCATNWRFIPVR